MWINSFQIAMADYSKIELYTFKYKQHINIVNNLYGNAVRLKFSNLYNDKNVILKNIFVKIGNHEKIAVKQNNSNEIFLKKQAFSYSDEIKIMIYPMDNISIFMEFEDNFKITDAVILPDTDILKVDSKENLICKKNNANIEFLTDIPKGFKYLLSLCAIEILSDEKVECLAFFGDSLTQIPYHVSYIMKELFKIYNGKITYKNMAISGNRLLYDTAQLEGDVGQIAGRSGVSRFEKDIFSGIIPQYVFILEGTNDLLFPNLYNKYEEISKDSDIIDGLIKCIKICHKYETKPILLTIPPCNEVDYSSIENEKKRLSINMWIRKQKYCNFIDVDSYVSDDEDASKLKYEYKNLDDNLHLNRYGGEMLGKAILMSDVMIEIMGNL